MTSVILVLHAKKGIYILLPLRVADNKITLMLLKEPLNNHCFYATRLMK